MEEPLTISKEAPSRKSQDYELLREEALNYIQNIAGKVWTDYNTHDPGITILEVLCYAITDLGYRASFDVKDLIALPPEQQGEEIYNFFTARQILPNAPVTYADYRKLMIDVEVHDPEEPECGFAGVKNAWIEKADGPELNVYVNRADGELSYDPENPGDTPLDLQILHTVLLEFNNCEKYGDLNENKLVQDLVITDHDPDEELEGLVIRVDVEFPRWDDPAIDWSDPGSIGAGIKAIEIRFLNLPGNFEISYEVDASNQVSLDGTKTSDSGPDPIAGLGAIATQINDFIHASSADSLVSLYSGKINKVLQIVEEVKQTVHANRDLCEDFVEFRALRIEEILMCGDIELELDADVEQVQAEMYHEIAKFLSPTVFFYSLQEMMTRCFDAFRYDILSISQDERFFVIDHLADPLPENGFRVTVTGSNNNNDVYTVKKASLDEREGTTVIYVEESIASEIPTEGEQLYLADLSEDQCTPTEQIFEGPRLQHGFIDNAELQLADRKKVIHVSDLIQIIMEVDGVIAVQNLQVANRPQDNETGVIEEKNVRWCLQLAFAQNYVPRLNTDDSRITFYKDQLPFKARQTEVDDIISELEAEERPQKLHRIPLDITPPEGIYYPIEEYESIQNEFPLVYGIGEDGLSIASEKSGTLPPGVELPKKADVRQLKGFLMQFDQLLANYLSQLAHVKDLFSMNPQRNEFGEFLIGRTYYTQPLFDAVADADELYVDKDGHAADLNEIAESDEVFADRRNRFLDHLAARFAEQFTDYAMLMYRLSGAKASDELIEDKLAFLNGYPKMSYRRGTGFDYRSGSAFWHKDNVSGLEKRAALLAGINEPQASELVFSPNFTISESGGVYSFSIENSGSTVILSAIDSYENADDAKEALERVIVSGTVKQNYRILTEDETNYFIQLYSGVDAVAVSTKTDFTSDLPGDDADLAVDEMVSVLTGEFLDNSQSNRHNLACALLNRFRYTVSVDMAASPPEFTIDYELYPVPIEFSGTPVLTGSYTGAGDDRRTVSILDVNTGTGTIRVEGNVQENLVAGDTVNIEGSADNDGSYTIDSFSLSGDDTEIIVNETLTSDSDPLGDLLINQITETEMSELAEDSVQDVLWNVVANGVRRQRYGFDPGPPDYTSPYRFLIRDYRGNVLGESVDSDFNTTLATEIENTTNGELRLFTATDEGDLYSITSATARGPFVDITVSGPVDPIPAFNWTAEIQNEFVITAIDQESRSFGVHTDLTGVLKKGDQIYIKDSVSNDGGYTILALNFDGTTTTLQVREPVPSAENKGIDGATDPVLGYTKQFEVTKATSTLVTVRGGLDELAVEAMIELLTVAFFSREGMHVIEHILLRPRSNEATYQDQLLRINLDEDCECTLEDPYTCVAHVVMPYWPGRFTNQDFRKFFENTLRREAPAHVYLTVCWVSCTHMAGFEHAYKSWLIEQKRSPQDPESLSNALNELIESIAQLRNVYPGGTLHDCEENDNFEDSIILNNSVLGEI